MFYNKPGADFKPSSYLGKIQNLKGGLGATVWFYAPYQILAMSNMRIKAFEILNKKHKKQVRKIKSIQHVLVALQYQEASSCSILMKCIFCNFTCWMPPAFSALDARPPLCTTLDERIIHLGVRATKRFLFSVIGMLRLLCRDRQRWHTWHAKQFPMARGSSKFYTSIVLSLHKRCIFLNTYVVVYTELFETLSRRTVRKRLPTADPYQYCNVQPMNTQVELMWYCNYRFHFFSQNKQLLASLKCKAFVT